MLLEVIRHSYTPPPLNARNLFHLSAAMYDAWAVYDPIARPFLAREKQIVDDPGAAQRCAVAFAGYRFLLGRLDELDLLTPEINAGLAARLRSMGFDPNRASASSPEDPASVGRRAAETVLSFGRVDGMNRQDKYGFDPKYRPVNPELIYKLPGNPDCQDPNRWQPIAYDYLLTQDGLSIGAAIQRYTCPSWGDVAPFALVRHRDYSGRTWLDPGPPPMLGGDGHDDSVAAHIELIRLSSELDPAQSEMIDIGPASNHNAPLGTDLIQGRSVNPATGLPYAPVTTNKADYLRVIAEFWADGPHSETPPGHWNILANERVSDDSRCQYRVGGTQIPSDRLEWDVKLGFALNGALHDAAIVAWGIKGAYDGNRPIQVIRYMADRGQSTDPKRPRFDPLGLPLIPGLIEQISENDVQRGGRFAHLIEQREDPISGATILDDHIGDIAIRAWRGAPDDPSKTSGVGWILASHFVPYQDPAQITPPFAGYTSGHSCFSQAAAALLERFTGDPFFPGGISEERVPKGWLVFEEGPTADVVLTWATYRDAADEASRSRRSGGIHAAYDDYPSRLLGAEVGQRAYEYAMSLFNNTTGSSDINADGSVDDQDLDLLICNLSTDNRACPADLNQDGLVDDRDLAQLLIDLQSPGSASARASRRP